MDLNMLNPPTPKPHAQKVIEKFLMLIISGAQQNLRLMVVDGQDTHVVLGIDTGKRFVPLARMLTEAEAHSVRPSPEFPGFDVAQDDPEMNEIVQQLVEHNLSPDDLLQFFTGTDVRIDPTNITADDIAALLRGGGA